MARVTATGEGSAEAVKRLLSTLCLLRVRGDLLWRRKLDGGYWARAAGPTAKSREARTAPGRLGYESTLAARGVERRRVIRVPLRYLSQLGWPTRISKSTWMAHSDIRVNSDSPLGYPSQLG
jgi:hypothetical protein